ncbi:MAG: glutamine--fructose-6-phosphate transaminase (isomerizing), partial [Acidimicrobiales bacterium]
ATFELWLQKAAVRAQSLPELRKRLESSLPPAGAPGPHGAGIGHTRWATHGAPTEANAHPHLDCTGRIAIAHNGIIENHRALRARLTEAGHHFASGTDSEVIAHLIEDELEAGRDLAGALRACLEVLDGDFAIVATSVGEPDLLVGTRRTSPLIVGVAESMGLVASDIAAGLATTRELFVLGDDEVVEVRPGRLRVTTAEGVECVPRALEVRWEPGAAEREGFEDFMSKEIHEQPRALADTLLGRVSPGGATDIEELGLGTDELGSIERVSIIACGSSFHAGLVGRACVESWARLPTTTEIASEFRYRDPVLDERTLVIAISQSGETVDTFQALREARRKGARAVVLTNVVDSLMAREADGVLYTRAGPEIGVASTKCHLAQLAMLELFALHLAMANGAVEATKLQGLARHLLELPAAVESALGRRGEYAAAARRLAGVNDVYFLGRGLGLPVALEGALKLKELAYIRAEAYPAGEMKHGPISLIEPGVVAVVVATRGRLWEKVMANVAEVQARGASVMAVCDEDDTETPGLVDEVMMVPHLPELLSPVVNVVPLQVLAYSVAKARGNDVDRPRNLAKVVTVE